MEVLRGVMGLDGAVGLDGVTNPIACHDNN